MRAVRPTVRPRKNPKTKPRPGRKPGIASFRRYVRLADGTKVTLRPIRPSDAAAERAFIQRLSPQSRYQRFFGPMEEVSDAAIAAFTEVDFTRAMALVATTKTPDGEIQIGVARYHIVPGTRCGEFAIVVADEWHGKGVARRLLNALMAAGRKHHRLKALVGEALSDNVRMIGLARALDFTIDTAPQDARLVRLRRKL
jgi:acetyltransferase